MRDAIRFAGESDVIGPAPDWQAFATLDASPYNPRLIFMRENYPQSAYAAVIFDVDGTLTDTFPSFIRIVNQVAGRRLEREFSLDDLIPYFGPPEDALLKNFFADETEHRAVMSDYYRSLRAARDEIKAFAGIADLVAGLHRNGVKLAVYTGASTLAGSIRLQHAGIFDYFDEVMGGDQVNNYKPHPEGLHILLDRLGVESAQAIFVGDSPADIRAGREAGMATAGVTWGAGTKEALIDAAPDYLIDQPAALGAILLEPSANNKPCQ